MASFQQYRESYARNWANLSIRPNREAEADKAAERVFAGKTRYLDVQRRTGVPWWFVGLCHLRESDLRFDRQLGQGDPLDRVSTHVPKGMGPYKTFEDSAVAALKLEGFVNAGDWGVERTSYRFEGFNGYGYHGKGVPSPYLYGGSTIYTAGKYVADHQFDQNFRDPQLGVLVVLKKLMELDPTIHFDGTVATEAPEPDEQLAHGVLWIQQSLNALGADPKLVEDGKNGKNTKTMLARFQKESGLSDTGLPDSRTIAEIERHLAASQKPAAPLAPLPFPPARPSTPPVGAGLKPAPTAEPLAPPRASPAPPAHPATLAAHLRGALHAIFG
jgi:lysozyme family protein